MKLALVLLCAATLGATPIRVPGLKAKVEILRDKWGVPHIYAENPDDLFLAQGWIAAKDRLFQIDLWRRIGTGKLAEVLGPAYVPRDRIARLVRFRGSWNDEWSSYSPDAQAIATSFTRGINEYVKSLKGWRPDEFAAARYDPGLWEPQDVTARIAGLQMLRNATVEITHALEVQQFGIENVQKYLDLNPPVKLEIPKGLDLSLIRTEMIRDYQAAIGPVRFDDGSNNWVVDGSMSATGKPLLANDPHRTISIPSLRKTVHLVAPGWNVIGAGEPALPGIALGHNEEIAFGFTIVGIDQQDLYIEKLNPENPNQYRHQGSWREMDIEKTQIAVKGRAPATVMLKYTMHGPVIYEDPDRHAAVALRWVGADPGGAGYLSALRISRTKNWAEFKDAAGKYKTPSENLIYADRTGNIGWIASGQTPIRKNWTGLLPVPGDTGEYEWSGYLSVDQLPQRYNPTEHWIATANANHLPPGYPYQLGYEFAAPFRFERLKQIFTGQQKFSLDDFAKMQYDITSVPAQRFQSILKKWTPSTPRTKAIRERMLKWDCRIDANSFEALIFEVWMLNLPKRVFGNYASMTAWPQLLKTLEVTPNHSGLSSALDDALSVLENGLGPEGSKWTWGEAHRLSLRHALNRQTFHVAPIPRSGDANTVMAAGWPTTQPFQMNHGASYRQIMDTADWDRSVVTNVPGESGDPTSKHYKDLLPDWLAGKPHPLPYSRKAVEAATEEKIELLPAN